MLTFFSALWSKWYSAQIIVKIVILFSCLILLLPKMQERSAHWTQVKIFYKGQRNTLDLFLSYKCVNTWFWWHWAGLLNITKRVREKNTLKPQSVTKKQQESEKRGGEEIRKKELFKRKDTVCFFKSPHSLTWSVTCFIIGPHQKDLVPFWCASTPDYCGAGSSDSVMKYYVNEWLKIDWTVA